MNAGAGAYSNVFSISCPVGRYCDNGGIAAIIYAIDELRNSEVQNIVFFIDSQTAITSLIRLSNNQNALVHLRRIKLHFLIKTKDRAAIQWILSHCDIYGNVQIDRLSKSLVAQPDSLVPLRNIRIIIHNKIKDSRTSLYVHAAQDKKWKVLLDKNNKFPNSFIA